MAGSFESACRLLHDQLGIVNFEPFESIFINLYSSSRTITTWQQNVPSNFTYPLRNWKDAGPKGGLPVAGIKLNDLVQKLQVLVTNLSLIRMLLKYNAFRFVIS
jgi:coatomer protein complex subunit alpha (xenin)